jgi:hypothetical protein
MAEHEKNAPPAQRGPAPGKSPGEEKNKPRRLKFSFCTCGGIPATPPVDLEEIAANQRAVQLAAAHGLEYRYGADLTRLSRYVYPYLEEEDFVFANNWHCCLWVLDNHFDGTDGTLEEKLGLIRQLHSALEKIALGPGAEAPGPQKDAEEALGPARPVVPPSEARARAFVGLLGAALRPVLRRLGPRLRQHMATQVAEYFRGVEDHLLCDEDTLTLDEYAAIRVADSAYETVWPLMYLGLGDLLDLGEASARGLRRRANQCGRIINDVYSVPKDRAAGVKFNAVFILARELGISDAQAEKILVARANKLFRELPGTGKFSGFRLWCAGAAVWHDSAERYRDPGARPADESAAKTRAESGASNAKCEIQAKGQSLAAVLFSTNACPEWSPTSDDEYSGYN